MNLAELKSLGVFPKELKRLREQIEDLETKVESCTAKNDGMPKGSRKASFLLEQLIDLKTRYENKLLVRENEKARIEEELYYETEGYPLEREAIIHKYIHLRSWGQTARKLGGHNTRDSVRKMVFRFFKKKGWI